MALGVSPDAEDAEDHIAPLALLLERTTGDGIRSGRPIDWLWWGERNGVPFHSDWWMAITPQGPIGFDGQHFALLRDEMLSDAFLQHERRLITKWARKPYWTPREAIDLSLNFGPFTTDSWRGQEPEFGDTIRERDDRFRTSERAVEAGDISEKAAPKDYVLWLDKCGYIVSEAWRRAVGLESKVFGHMEQAQLATLLEENAQLRQNLENLATKTDAQDDVQRQLATLGDENENLRRQLVEQEKTIRGFEEQALQSGIESNSSEDIKELKKRIRLLHGERANYNEVGALTRRVEFLEIILLAAAVDGHSYDPRAGKSPIPKEIADKATALGNPIAQSTVRKYLQESSTKHIEPGVWEVIFPKK
ncbi:hypothetical protein [Shimia sagamensis]|uniref:hypothetical protein n=1 Tax=Shimia sagamensis TaxID=1566352 RepID=UPI0024B6D9F6|nr:hypothetical protein [Shimia sagamensis]